MNTNSNTGHAKNMANLAVLTQVIETMGAAYNPSNSNLSLEALKARLLDSQNTLSEVNQKLNAWKLNTNLREIGFKKFDDLITRLQGALASSQVTPQTLNDFDALIKKVRGGAKLSKADAGRVVPKEGEAPVEEEPGVSHKLSKQSFDGKLEVFSQMILLLKSEQYYQPNEFDYSVEGLQSTYANLQMMNSLANQSMVELKAVRSERNTNFYGEGDSLLETVKQTKNYVKSLLGNKSQHYKTLKSIKFFRVVPAKKAK
jgi:hypothetical protein